VQAVGIDQFPVESHVWVAVLLAHCTAPGEQPPVQTPPTHA
jgi:hypothetical protein